MTLDLAERLASVCHTIEYSQLPSEVVHEASRRILDTLGCTIAGARTGAAGTIAQLINSGDGGGPATLIATGSKVSVANAVLGNCSALRQLDFMDGHPGPYPAHASFNVLPALAAAEATACSGRKLIEAVVAGYEANIRLQLGIGEPNLSKAGWSASSIFGISAAVAMGVAMNLSEDALRDAIAIAATHSPTLDAAARGAMPDSKTCVDALVAFTSAAAVLLAAGGIHGPTEVFEGPAGIKATMSNRVDENIIGDPIDKFRILRAYTKRFNTIKCAQTALGIALDLSLQVPSGWRGMKQISIKLAEPEYEHMVHDEELQRRPTSRDIANHSVFYSVAAGLVRGELGPNEFSPGSLHDAGILSVVDRITIEADASLNDYWPACSPATVSIVTDTNDVLEATELHFPGDPDNPLSDAEIESKFRALVASNISPAKAQEIIDAVWRLDQFENIQTFTELLTPQTT